MPRYIDADMIPFLGNTEYTTHRLIETVPTADVVEVVRCKDCKWQGNDAYCPVCNLCGDDELPNGDWYCADGERREE